LLKHSSRKATGTIISGGGAICLEGSSKLQADDSVFDTNHASFGGALFVSGSAVAEFTNGEVRFNNVSQEGNGGGFYCTQDSICRVSGSTIKNNAASGGLGGGIYCNGRCQLFSENNLYTENFATYGAAHYADDTSVSQMLSDRFELNEATNNGGGAEVSADSQVTWKYCNFYQNKASGTLALILRGSSESKCLIDSCVFDSFGVYKNNEAIVGAIGGSVQITNSTFKNGFAAEGGGLQVAGSTAEFVMEDCLFRDNTAFDKGAVTISGLALADTDTKLEFIIRNTRFENNRAISSGGALGAQGVNDNFRVRFIDCEFVNNEAGVSGGVGSFDESGIYSFENCLFDSNSAQYGGSIGVTGEATVRVEKTQFQSNSGLNGGALFATSNGAYEISSSTFQSNKATGKGGVFYSDFLSKVCPSFTNVKFIDNSAVDSGGALYFDLGRNQKSSSSSSCAKLSAFCDKCSFSKNKVSLGYGVNYATSPTALVPIELVPNRLYPSQTFNTSFVVRDAFNQTLLGFIGE